MKRRMDKSIIENESDTRIDDLIRKDFDWDIRYIHHIPYNMTHIPYNIPYNMTHYGL